MKIDPVADVTAPDVLEDRRRPGRQNDANPELIDLLRGSADSRLLAAADEDDTSPMATSRGIRKAILLSVPIWALAIGLTVWLLR
jgi:hypothetical protein